MSIQHKNFDTVLVCKGDDFKNIVLVVENIRRLLAPDNIFVICPEIDITEHSKSFTTDKKVHFINEENVLPFKRIDFRHLNLPGFPNRYFWYYQQFLKIAFCISNISSHAHILVWDADTIPIRKVSFFDSEKILLTTSENEYHTPYFETIKNLFNQPFTLQNLSFISQHTMVKCAHMNRLVQSIEHKFGLEWPAAIMGNLQGNSVSLFSEYEVYANFVLNRFPNHYIVRKLSYYRKGSYLFNYVSEASLAQKFDFIALEKSNNSKFKSYLRSAVFKVFGWY